MTPHLNPTISASISILTRYLTSALTKRSPKNCAAGFDQARNAAEDETTRIFLDTKTSVWFAYFLAEQKLSGSYTGKHADQRTLDALDNLSVEDRKLVAEAVAAIDVHDSVQFHIMRLDSKHRRLSDMTPSTASRTSTSTTTWLQGDTATTPLAVSNSVPDGTSNSEQPMTITIPRSNFRYHADEMLNSSVKASSDPEEQTISNPRASRLARIFPQYMCGAIQKDGEGEEATAALTMVFPTHLSVRKVDCLMSLAILPHKIQYLAYELFGILMESDAGHWYVIFENGARVAVVEAVLQGAASGSVLSLLGNQPNSAITKSPLRKDEVWQAKLVTNCVTLRIHSSYYIAGILNLNMELDEAFKLKEALFL